ncbi:hypothetical protein PC116_g5917 [Phytophthora cactorum]|nr:hypothetical protein PC116_g5917 [Phytophthora cactorum]
MRCHHGYQGTPIRQESVALSDDDGDNISESGVESGNPSDTSEESDAL